MRTLSPTLTDLFKLIDTCLDNQNFFLENKRTKIIGEKSTFYQKYYVHLLSSISGCPSYECEKKIKQAIFDKHNITEKNFKDVYGGFMEITFDGLPQLVIWMNRKQKKLIEEEYTHTTKNKKFWKPFSEKHETFKYEFIEYELSPEINFGKIKAEITLEDFEKILKHYFLSKERFNQVQKDIEKKKNEEEIIKQKQMIKDRILIYSQ